MAETQLTRAQQFDRFVARKTEKMVQALPFQVSDEELNRAQAQFSLAFSSDTQGDLVKCSPDSMARALALSALSGLMPGGPKPDVWLIPRKNKDVWEVTWQIGWNGYLRLARRNGWDMEAVLVYEGDEFAVQQGAVTTVTHVPGDPFAAREWKDLRGGYVRVWPVNCRSEAKIAVLGRPAIQKRRNVAQTDKVWSTWWEEMSLKTLLSYAGAREMFPLSERDRYAINVDQDVELLEDAAPAARRITSSNLVLDHRPDEEVYEGGVEAESSDQETGEVISSAAAKRIRQRATAAGMSDAELKDVVEEVAPGAGGWDGVPASAAEQILTLVLERTAAVKPAAATLDTKTVERLATKAKTAGVSWGEIEELYGGPLAEYLIPEGQTQASIEADIIEEIDDRAKAAKKKR